MAGKPKGLLTKDGRERVNHLGANADIADIGDGAHEAVGDDGVRVRHQADVAGVDEGGSSSTNTQ